MIVLEMFRFSFYDMVIKEQRSSEQRNASHEREISYYRNCTIHLCVAPALQSCTFDGKIGTERAQHNECAHLRWGMT